MSYEAADLSAVVAEQSHDLLFATVSGVHVLPLNEVVGLKHGPETKERGRPANCQSTRRRSRRCTSSWSKRG